MEEKPRQRSTSSFWSRAASIVNPVRLLKGSSDSSDDANSPHSPQEKLYDGVAEKDTLEKSSSHQSGPTREEVQADDRDRRRYVATIPPWIHSVVEGEDLTLLEVEGNQNRTLIKAGTTIPAPIRPAQHHYLPIPIPRLNAPPGRRFDHERSNDAVTAHTTLNPSQWAHYVHAVDDRPQSHRTGAQQSSIVSQDWLDANMPDLDSPWNPAGMSKDEAVKDERIWLLHHDARMQKWHKFQDILMKNPFVPLAIRIIVLLFVLAALALGCYIYKESSDLNRNPFATFGTSVGPETDRDSYICKQQASTYLAFIVDSIGVLYIVYITYDEYFSKPLGLRRSRDKMRLLFLDLIFIIFSAANLSLAFSTLTDQQWACYHTSEENSTNAQAATSLCIYDKTLCHRQRALVGVLTVAVVAWVTTFTISTLRVVERISR